MTAVASVAADAFPRRVERFAPRRVLVIKLAAIGDAVMASTIIPAARTRWPASEITWVAGRSVAPLARLFDGVDRVVEVDDVQLLRGGPAARASTLARAWAAIGRGYDLALIAHGDRRYRTLVWWCGARDVRQVAFGQHASANGWHGAGYAALVDGQLAATCASHSAPYAALRADRLDVLRDQVWAEPFVVISPGGARNVLRDDNLRRWPLEHWVSLTRDLVSSGLRVVAVGSGDDAAETAACAAAGARDCAGQTPIDQLVAVLARASCVIAHDSGVLHVAMLAGSPCIALFGPTRPEERIPPDGRVTVMSAAAGLSCAPCYDGFRYAVCGRNACLADVPAAAVAAEVRALLSNDRDRRQERCQ